MKQVDLQAKYVQFVPNTYYSAIYPKPPDDTIARIEKQRSNAMKKRLKKKIGEKNETKQKASAITAAQRKIEEEDKNYENSE